MASIDDNKKKDIQVIAGIQEANVWTDNPNAFRIIGVGNPFLVNEIASEEKTTEEIKKDSYEDPTQPDSNANSVKKNRGVAA